MTITKITYQFILPIWAVAPLEYGDETGLTAKESKAIFDLTCQFAGLHVKHGTRHHVIAWGEELEFEPFNDMPGFHNQGGRCINATLTIIH